MSKTDSEKIPQNTSNNDIQSEQKPVNQIKNTSIQRQNNYPSLNLSNDSRAFSLEKNYNQIQDMDFDIGSNMDFQIKNNDCTSNKDKIVQQFPDKKQSRYYSQKVHSNKFNQQQQQLQQGQQIISSYRSLKLDQNIPNQLITQGTKDQLICLPVLTNQPLTCDCRIQNETEVQNKYSIQEKSFFKLQNQYQIPQQPPQQRQNQIPHYQITYINFQINKQQNDQIQLQNSGQEQKQRPIFTPHNSNNGFIDNYTNAFSYMNQMTTDVDNNVNTNDNPLPDNHALMINNQQNIQHLNKNSIQSNHNNEANMFYGFQYLNYNSLTEIYSIGIRNPLLDQRINAQQEQKAPSYQERQIQSMVQQQYDNNQYNQQNPLHQKLQQKLQPSSSFSSRPNSNSNDIKEENSQKLEKILGSRKSKDQGDERSSISAVKEKQEFLEDGSCSSELDYGINKKAFIKKYKHQQNSPQQNSSQSYGNTLIPPIHSNNKLLKQFKNQAYQVRTHYFEQQSQVYKKYVLNMQNTLRRQYQKCRLQNDKIYLTNQQQQYWYDRYNSYHSGNIGNNTPTKVDDHSQIQMMLPQAHRKSTAIPNNKFTLTNQQIDLEVQNIMNQLQQDQHTPMFGSKQIESGQMQLQNTQQTPPPVNPDQIKNSNSFINHKANQSYDQSNQPSLIQSQHQTAKFNNSFVSSENNNDLILNNIQVIECQQINTSNSNLNDKNQKQKTNQQQYDQIILDDDMMPNKQNELNSNHWRQVQRIEHQANLSVVHNNNIEQNSNNNSSQRIQDLELTCSSSIREQQPIVLESSHSTVHVQQQNQPQNSKIAQLNLLQTRNQLKHNRTQSHLINHESQQQEQINSPSYNQHIQPQHIQQQIQQITLQKSNHNLNGQTLNAKNSMAVQPTTDTNMTNNKIDCVNLDSDQQSLDIPLLTNHDNSKISSQQRKQNTTPLIADLNYNNLEQQNANISYQKHSQIPSTVVITQQANIESQINNTTGQQIALTDIQQRIVQPHILKQSQGIQNAQLLSHQQQQTSSQIRFQNTPQIGQNNNKNSQLHPNINSQGQHQQHQQYQVSNNQSTIPPSTIDLIDLQQQNSMKQQRQSPKFYQPPEEDIKLPPLSQNQQQTLQQTEQLKMNEQQNPHQTLITIQNSIFTQNQPLQQLQKQSSSVTNPNIQLTNSNNNQQSEDISQQSLLQRPQSNNKPEPIVIQIENSSQDIHAQQKTSHISKGQNAQIQINTTEMANHSSQQNRQNNVSAAQIRSVLLETYPGLQAIIQAAADEEILNLYEELTASSPNQGDARQAQRNQKPQQIIQQEKSNSNQVSNQINSNSISNPEKNIQSQPAQSQLNQEAQQPQQQFLDFGDRQDLSMQQLDAVIQTLIQTTPQIRQSIQKITKQQLMEMYKQGLKQSKLRQQQKRIKQKNKTNVKEVISLQSDDQGDGKDKGKNQQINSGALQDIQRYPAIDQQPSIEVPLKKKFTFLEYLNQLKRKHEQKQARKLQQHKKNKNKFEPVNVNVGLLINYLKSQDYSKKLKQLFQNLTQQKVKQIAITYVKTQKQKQKCLKNNIFIQSAYTKTHEQKKVAQNLSKYGFIVTNKAMRSRIHNQIKDQQLKKFANKQGYVVLNIPKLTDQQKERIREMKRQKAEREKEMRERHEALYKSPLEQDIMSSFDVTGSRISNQPFNLPLESDMNHLPIQQQSKIDQVYRQKINQNSQKRQSNKTAPLIKTIKRRYFVIQQTQQLQPQLDSRQNLLVEQQIAFTQAKNKRVKKSYSIEKDSRKIASIFESLSKDMRFNGDNSEQYELIGRDGQVPMQLQ